MDNKDGLLFVSQMLIISQNNGSGKLGSGRRLAFSVMEVWRLVENPADYKHSPAKYYLFGM